MRSLNPSRRVTLFLAVVLLTVMLFGTLATPQTAKAFGPTDFCFLNGQTFSGSGIPFPPPPDYNWSGVSGSGAKSPTYVYDFPNGQLETDYLVIYFDGVSYSYTAVISISNCTTTFHDGRINNRDAGQTVAIYCQGGETGGIFTLVPASPVWKLGLVVTAAEVNAVKANADHPVLIKKKGHVSLYRLQDGRLQINAPGINPEKEDYNFIFSDCGL